MPSIFKSKLFWAVAVPLCGLLFAVGIWYWRTMTVEARLDELRAQGLPVAADEVNDFYVVPDGVADTTEIWIAAIDAIEAADLEKRGSTLPLIGSKGPTAIPPAAEEWPELEASRALLDELEAELNSVYRAAEAGGQVRFPVDFSAGYNTLLPYIQESRGVARLLVLDAHVRARDGDHARAHQDVQAVFRLSQAMSGEPLLISHLVRLAIFSVGCDAVEELLPHCQWSDVQWESLQSTIQSASLKDELRNALRGERALCITGVRTTALAPFRTANVMELLDLFEIAIDGTEGPWNDALARQRELKVRVGALSGSSLLRLKYMGVLMLFPALEQCTIAGARAEARLRCTVAAIAAHRYRLVHGRLPESLTDIESRFFGSGSSQSDRLVDPFSGKPLHYKIEEARAVIYSVGDDQNDDGGACESEGRQQPRDVGIALPL